MKNNTLYIDAWKFEVSAIGNNPQKVRDNFWHGVDLCDTMRGGQIKRTLRKDIIQMLHNIISDKAAK